MPMHGSGQLGAPSGISGDNMMHGMLQFEKSNDFLTTGEASHRASMEEKQRIATNLDAYFGKAGPSQLNDWYDKSNYQESMETYSDAFKVLYPNGSSLVPAILVAKLSSSQKWAMLIAPLERTTSNEWTFQVIEFNQTTLTRIADRGPTRKGTYTRRSITAQGTMYGHAYENECAFIGTPIGHQIHLASLQQMMSAAEVTIIMKIMHAIMHHKPYRMARSLASSNSRPRHEIEKMIYAEIAAYGAFHKNPKGIDLVDIEMSKELRARNRGEGNIVILPGGCNTMLNSQIMNLRWQAGLRQQRDYRWNPRSSDCTAFESFAVSTGEDDNNPIDHHFERTVRGLFHSHSAQHLRDVSGKDYRTYMLDVQIRDGQTKQMVNMRVEDGIRMCGVWDMDRPLAPLTSDLGKGFVVDCRCFSWGHFIRKYSERPDETLQQLVDLPFEKRQAFLDCLSLMPENATESMSLDRLQLNGTRGTNSNDDDDDDDNDDDDGDDFGERNRQAWINRFDEYMRNSNSADAFNIVLEQVPQLGVRERREQERQRSSARTLMGMDTAIDTTTTPAGPVRCGFELQRGVLTPLGVESASLISSTIDINTKSGKCPKYTSLLVLVREITRRAQLGARSTQALLQHLGRVIRASLHNTPPSQQEHRGEQIERVFDRDLLPNLMTLWPGFVLQHELQSAIKAIPRDLRTPLERTVTQDQNDLANLSQQPDLLLSTGWWKVEQESEQENGSISIMVEPSVPDIGLPLPHDAYAISLTHEHAVLFSVSLEEDEQKGNSEYQMDIGSAVAPVKIDSVEHALRCLINGPNQKREASFIYSILLSFVVMGYISEVSDESQVKHSLDKKVIKKLRKAVPPTRALLCQQHLTDRIDDAARVVKKIIQNGNYAINQQPAVQTMQLTRDQMIRLAAANFELPAQDVKATPIDMQVLEGAFELAQRGIQSDLNDNQELDVLWMYAYQMVSQNLIGYAQLPRLTNESLDDHVLAVNNQLRALLQTKSRNQQAEDAIDMVLQNFTPCYKQAAAAALHNKKDESNANVGQKRTLTSASGMIQMAWTIESIRALLDRAIVASGSILLFFLENNIFLPVMPEGFRPFIMDEMGAMVKMNSGCMKTLYSNENMKWGESVVQKTIQGNWTLYLSVVVHTPQDIVIRRNVFRQSTIAGDRCSVYNPLDEQQMTAFRDNIFEHDVIYVLNVAKTPKSSSSNRPTFRSIAGRMPNAYGASADVDREQWYPGCNAVARYYNLQPDSTKLMSEQTFDSQSSLTKRRDNVMCMQARQNRYSHATKDWTMEVLSAGHWGAQDDPDNCMMVNTMQTK